ncbi:hypothetical protein PMO31116_04498 [Pandoraea morbifera]|uniref:Uncharacterized protein n=1 Tax=Pandoraea morbifera TaxID=2508300 RepID=A0A5E4YJ50_9BURK|nr:hypothetical protein PMO31116_04498 [Pandoraea morbifera]
MGIDRQLGKSPGQALASGRAAAGLLLALRGDWATQRDDARRGELPEAQICERWLAQRSICAGLK